MANDLQVKVSKKNENMKKTDLVTEIEHDRIVETDQNIILDQSNVVVHLHHHHRLGLVVRRHTQNVHLSIENISGFFALAQPKSINR